MPISTKALREAFRDIDPVEAFKLSKVIAFVEQPSSEKDREKALEYANKVIEGFGVEVIRGSAGPGRFWQDAVAAYVNTGDTYNATVLYDTIKHRFYLTTMGDFVEKYEKKYGIF